MCWSMPLEDLIEAIEIVTELQQDIAKAGSSEQDIFEALGLE